MVGKLPPLRRGRNGSKPFMRDSAEAGGGRGRYDVLNCGPSVDRAAWPNAKPRQEPLHRSSGGRPAVGHRENTTECGRGRSLSSRVLLQLHKLPVVASIPAASSSDLPRSSSYSCSCSAREPGSMIGSYRRSPHPSGAVHAELRRGIIESQEHDIRETRPCWPSERSLCSGSRTANGSSRLYGLRAGTAGAQQAMYPLVRRVRDEVPTRCVRRPGTAGFPQLMPAIDCTRTWPRRSTDRSVSESVADPGREQRHALVSGAAETTRTSDLLITNQLLYQLSYSSKGAGL